MAKRKISAAQRKILIERLKKARAARKSNKRTRTLTKSTRRTRKVAKRKATRRRSTRRKANFSGVMATGLGVGSYILFESMIEPRIIQMLNITNPLVVNVAELAAAMWASKKSGVVGQMGKAAIVVNLYQILHPYLSTMGAKNVSSNGLFN